MHETGLSCNAVEWSATNRQEQSRAQLGNLHFKRLIAGLFDYFMLNFEFSVCQYTMFIYDVLQKPGMR